MNKSDNIGLPKTVVGIDVETTSLDPATGKIIEIAAIRYDTKTGKVINKYIKLCSSGLSLSPEITAITGITNEMISNKKPFNAHINQLREFISDSIIFAHNASFDIKYMAYHGLKLDNHVWDTFALSSIAWPTAESYNLGMLIQQNNIEVSGEHRAGADVQMTWMLLQEIIKKLKVPKDVYNQTENILIKSNLAHYFPLFSIGTNSTHRINKNKISHKTNRIKSGDTLKKILGPKGSLSKSIKGFQYRPQQYTMAMHVQKTIENNDISLIEAGTGVGKTYGYLIPLLLHYVNTDQSKTSPESGHTYTISTFTKHLQDQLHNEDIPALTDILGVDIKTAILKGRRNYLCTNRLQQAINRKSLKEDEAILFIKLLIWMCHDNSGDLEKINFSHQADKYLYHLHADSISCRQKCSTDNPNCPYYKARRAASKANLLIINHSLLAQAYSDDSLFSSTNLVIDEAHRLEEAFRKATQRDFSEHKLADVIAPFAQLAKNAPDITYKHIIKETQLIINEYQQVQTLLLAFITVHMNSDTVRLTPPIRSTASWKKVEEIALSWQGRMQFLIGLLRGITTAPSAKKSMEEAISEAEKFSSNFKTFIIGDSERIQWMDTYPSYNQQNKLELVDIALNVKAYLKPVFDGTRSIVLTSATLTVEDKYDYIKTRTGIDQCNEILLDTPFDYKKQMLIYIIDDAPHPSDKNFDDYISTNILSASKLTSGKLLGLFTSHKMIKEIYNKIVSELGENNIKLLAQKMTGGRHNIINKFKNTPSSVLLGTYSFWEGIDIPGSSLSLVLIAKLPFSNPHDPIINAISDHEKINSFSQINVPLMILKLRQGIGRLIRRQNDHGAVVIFDSRILKHEYGQRVLDSLPPATIHIGSTQDLIPTLTNWFGINQIKKWQKDGDKTVEKM